MFDCIRFEPWQHGSHAVTNWWTTEDTGELLLVYEYELSWKYGTLAYKGPFDDHWVVIHKIF